MFKRARARPLGRSLERWHAHLHMLLRVNYVLIELYQICTQRSLKRLVIYHYKIIASFQLWPWQNHNDFPTLFFIIIQLLNHDRKWWVVSNFVVCIKAGSYCIGTIPKRCTSTRGIRASSSDVIVRRPSAILCRHLIMPASDPEQQILSE